MDVLNFPGCVIDTCAQLAALGVIVVWAMCRKVWLSIKPLFQSIVDIYETINWERVSLVSLLRAMIVLVMLVMALYWELAKTIVKTCFNFVPFGHTMLRYLKKQMREVEKEHNILHYPLPCIMQRPSKKNGDSRNAGPDSEILLHHGRAQSPDDLGTIPKNLLARTQNCAAGNQNDAAGNQSSATGSQSSEKGSQTSTAGSQTSSATGSQTSSTTGSQIGGAAGGQNGDGGQNGAQQDPGHEKETKIEVPVEFHAPAQPEGGLKMKDDDGKVEIQGEGKAAQQGEGKAAQQGEGKAAQQGEGQAAQQGEGQATEQGKGQATGQGEGQVTEKDQGQATVQGEAAKQGKGA